VGRRRVAVKIGKPEHLLDLAVVSKRLTGFSRASLDESTTRKRGVVDR
jgi:hypothetical protein